MRRVLGAVSSDANVLGVGGEMMMDLAFPRSLIAINSLFEFGNTCKFFRI